MNPSIKSCSIYKRSDGFFVFANILTPYGGVSRVPPIVLPESASSEDLGDCINQQLKAIPAVVIDCDLGLAMSEFRSYIKKAGFKNPSAFEKGSKVIGVEYDGKSYSLIPYRAAERGGLLAEGTMRLYGNSMSQDVGIAVMQVFETEKHW